MKYNVYVKETGCLYKGWVRINRNQRKIVKYFIRYQKGLKNYSGWI